MRKCSKDRNLQTNCMFLINKQQEEIASGKQKVGENRSKYEPERKHKIGIIKPKSLTKLK